jgi:hypothetical protein
MAELVDRIGSDGRIRHVRDAEYFGWRFRNPLSRYRFLFWNDAGRLEGYLILQTSILPDRARTSIVDWEASRESVRADLLRAVIVRSGFEDLRVWTASLPGDARALLRDAGFRRTEAKAGVAAAQRRILVRPVRDDMREEDWVIAGRRLLEIGDWDLRMIDSDAY